MGGRGKNKARYRKDTVTRRKRTPATAATKKARIPGSPSGSAGRRNQKRNQRSWHGKRRFRLKKIARTEAEKF